MNQFSLEKGILSPDPNNRFIVGHIKNQEGKIIKEIKISAGFMFIHFNLGKEYSDNVKQLEKWMNFKLVEVFDEFVSNPDSFKEDVIEKKFIN
mgnify:CR=1 FL=1